MRAIVELPVDSVGKGGYYIVRKVDENMLMLTSMQTPYYWPRFKRPKLVRIQRQMPQIYQIRLVGKNSKANVFNLILIKMQFCQRIETVEESILELGDIIVIC